MTVTARAVNASGVHPSSSRRSALSAASLGLTFVAAAVQQARVALHPRYFDHNALYHLIQAAGLYLVFRGARTATRV
jgi:hypothetical protein